MGSPSYLAPNSVGFLSKFEPEELARLKSQFPGKAEQEFLEEQMGPLRPLLRAQIVAAVTALNSFLEVWRRRAPVVRAKLDRANRWSFGGAVLATLGSGAAVSLLLLGEGDTMAAPISAGLGLMGGLVGVTDRFLRQDLYGGEGSLVERLRELSVGAALASTYV